MALHLQGHNQSFRWKCSVCTFSAKTVAGLTRHSQAVHKSTDNCTTPPPELPNGAQPTPFKKICAKLSVENASLCHDLQTLTSRTDPTHSAGLEAKIASLATENIQLRRKLEQHHTATPDADADVVGMTQLRRENAELRKQLSFAQKQAMSLQADKLRAQQSILRRFPEMANMDGENLLYCLSLAQEQLETLVEQRRADLVKFNTICKQQSARIKFLESTQQPAGTPLAL